MKWVILFVVLAAAVFLLGMRFGRTASGTVAFQPVSELPDPVRAKIDRDLDSGLRSRAIRTYRSATGASTAAAEAAIETHRRRGSA